MNPSSWLVNRIVEFGGKVSFFQYMDWVLNDPGNGFYGSGYSSIGKDGDFVTSPSLGKDFANLLAKQVLEWLEQLERNYPNTIIFSIVEIGPGEGTLSFDLLKALKKLSPRIINKIELILVEQNEGMILKQKKLFKGITEISIKWLSLDLLEKSPVDGIVIANELLDAFPVERIFVDKSIVFRQGIKTNNENNLSYCCLPLTQEIKEYIFIINKKLNINFPPKDLYQPWVTELHTHLDFWFSCVSRILNNGTLLLIDYMLEANRYYSVKRSNGTLMAYKNQVASSNLLSPHGKFDLTSHLCIETIEYFSKKNEFKLIGNVRQGQALLALGLANEYHSLQNYSNKEIGIALERRENLLRLVDPRTFGEFRWIAFEKTQEQNISINFQTSFLNEPSNQ